MFQFFCFHSHPFCQTCQFFYQLYFIATGNICIQYFFCIGRSGKICSVCVYRRNNLSFCHSGHCISLYSYSFTVIFQCNFIARLQFFFSENSMVNKHSDIFSVQQMRYCIRSSPQIQQPTFFCCFFNPASIISITVKYNSLMVLNCLPDHFMEPFLKIFSLFEPVCVNFQTFCNSSIQHDICACNTV